MKIKINKSTSITIHPAGAILIVVVLYWLFTKT